MITDRDNEIIKTWFEPYKYATIRQIEKSYFKHQDYSYNIAARRLKKMAEAGQIKIYHDIATNKNIYIYKEDKIKPPSRHRIIILDVLAEMKYNGFVVDTFEIEKYWCGGKIRSDAFAIFRVDNRRYHFFIEVHTSHNPHNLEKYDELHDSGEVQKMLGKDFFPQKILLVADYEPSIKLKHCQIIRLNTYLDSFPTVLL